MKTVKNILDKITSYASVFIFIMMVLMVTYQVIARYIFSAPSSVTEILTRYALAFSGLVMVFGGFRITHMNFVQFDSILHIPTGIIYSIIPICGVIIIFYSIYNITLELKKEAE